MKNKGLPAKYYTDPSWFKRETEYFFADKWVCIGREEEVRNPGDYVVKHLAGESLLVTRDDNKKTNVFYNHCRHRGTLLVSDCKKGNAGLRFQCPYHAWTYGLDGKLLGAPHMHETEGFQLADYPLHSVRAETWAGHIFVNLNKNAMPLLDQIGGLKERFHPWRMETLNLIHRIEYSVKANWKLIVQNYSECIHCPIIHPALQKLSHYMSGENEPATTENYLGGRMVLKEGITTMSMDGVGKAPLPFLSEDERKFVYYYWLMPNLLLSLHPDYLLTHTLWPISEASTKIICEFHTHPDGMKEGSDFSSAIEFWDVTNKQDWHVSELSQIGIGSRAFSPGPYSVRESLLPGLDRMILELDP
jgi:glycine betaine catabolism A